MFRYPINQRVLELRLFFSLYLSTHHFFWERCQLFVCCERSFAKSQWYAYCHQHVPHLPGARLLFLNLRKTCYHDSAFGLCWWKCIPSGDNSFSWKMNLYLHRLKNFSNPAAARRQIKTLNLLRMRTKGALFKSK